MRGLNKNINCSFLFPWSMYSHPGADRIWKFAIQPSKMGISSKIPYSSIFHILQDDFLQFLTESSPTAQHCPAFLSFWLPSVLHQDRGSSQRHNLCTLRGWISWFLWYQIGMIHTHTSCFLGCFAQFTNTGWFQVTFIRLNLVATWGL